MRNYGAVHHFDGGTAAQQCGPSPLVFGFPSSGDIHGDTIVRVDGIGGRFAPPQPQLLLGGKDKVQVAGVAADQAEGLQHGCAGNAVIQVRRDQSRVHGEGGHPGHCCVSHLHQALGMGAVLGPNIQVEIL